MIVERVNGMVVVSELVGGYLVTRKYIGYTIGQAKAEFKRECGQ